MKAIARLCWTYCTALPIQRWLGWFMLGTWALVLLAFALSGRLTAWPASLLASLMYVLATTFATGFLFRSLSAPRTHRFLPRFRGRMLVAFLIVMAVVSMPGLAFLLLPARAVGGTTSTGLILLLSANLAALTSFTPGTGSGLLMLVPVSLVVFGGRTFGGVTDILGASATPVSIAVWIGGWTAFAVWYLRAREIRPLRFELRATVALARALEQRLMPKICEFSRDSAFAACLNARYPQQPKGALLGAAVALAAVAGISMLLRRFVPADAFAFVTAGLMILPLCMLAPLTNHLARRTRFLWLTSGMSRRSLFTALERAIWGKKVPFLLCSACVFATVALAYDLSAGRLAPLFPLWAAGTALAVYFGLVMRGGLIVELSAALALIPSLAVGVWAALGEPPRYDWLVGVVTAQLATAAALRALAIARWERLDWLTFRPLRAFSQSVRSRG